jgi:hypothetical protein
MQTRFFKILLSLFIGTSVCGISLAAEFRIENRVYSGDEKQPISRSSTIFHQAVVYDFLENPSETVIFDKAAGRFAILDNARRIRTELSTGELDDFTRKMKDRAEKWQDPLARFFAEPAFQERFDSKRRELLLQSELVSYKVVVLSAGNAAVAAEYREFSDWSARLNAMLVPGARPPFARLILNEALASHDVLAKEVILTVTAVKNGKRQPVIVRSEHDLSLDITPADLERIEYADQSMTKFRLVSFDKYRLAK